MSLSQRQQAVRRLDPSAFESATGREDIQVLKQGIYEAAQLLQVLEVVAMDADLATYHLQRAAVLQRPALPDADAQPGVTKHYEIQRAAYTQQSTALATLKGKVLQALDHEALRVVEEPIHGALRRSVLQILTSLTVEYQNLTHQELQMLRDRWKNLRWDASHDLLTFLATFKDQITFLEQHGEGPRPGEQIMQLQAAVAHVPVFAQMALSQFHTTHPRQVNQTPANMYDVYRNVYRAQYANTTAAQHYTASQAALTSTKVQTPAGTPALEGIMASARAALEGATITASTAEYMAAEVAKTLQRCMRPRQQLPGMCHKHPGCRHTWEECRLHPANNTAKSSRA